MSHVEAARHRLRITPLAIGGAAASLFAVLAFVARAGHPAAGSTTSSTVVTGPADVGPAGGAVPSIQSGGS